MGQEAPTQNMQKLQPQEVIVLEATGTHFILFLRLHVLSCGGRYMHIGLAGMRDHSIYDSILGFLFQSRQTYGRGSYLSSNNAIFVKSCVFRRVRAKICAR